MDQNAHPHLLEDLKGFSEQPGEFLIRIEGRFESSHYLYRYFPDGSDEPVHGHSWLVEAFLARTDGGLGADGISYDFLSARLRLNELVDRMEHVLINNLPEFEGINPTAENIGRWFYAGLKEAVEKEGACVREIRIHEGPYNYAVYRPFRGEAS
ncbi:MAG: 6-carboxytetrahydropterin synthase QueD [Leptospiraceae bacterium]|nr:6-carboxytetrahydropterin synthase QueD [Leptospiraceae bacterium]